MKIEEAFKGLKCLLGMERVMNKIQENMEKKIALLLIVYAIAFLVGENLRDYLSGYHDMVSHFFQPKSRELMNRLVFSLSHVALVEICSRGITLLLKKAS
jgi:hypothetical protein